MVTKKDKYFEIFRDASDQFFSNGDFAIPLAGYVKEEIKEKLADLGLSETFILVANESVVLDSQNYNIIATVAGVQIILPVIPFDNMLVRIANGSSGAMSINGNGKQIYDTPIFEMFEGESVSLFFGNDKWYLA